MRQLIIAVRLAKTRAAFQKYYEVTAAQSGKFPERFFSAE